MSTSDSKEQTLYFEELAQEECGCFESGVTTRFEKVGGAVEALLQHGGHTVTAIDSNRLLVFGGNSRTAEFYDHLVLIELVNTDTGHTTVASCKQLASAGLAPGARAGHTAVMHKNAMYILGGQIMTIVNGEAKVDILDDFWKLDLVSLDNPDGVKWEKLSVPMRARNAHSASVVGNKMYVFGGSDAKEGPLNAMEVVDFDTLTCTAVKCTGSVPPPREMHACVSIGSFLLISGGRGLDRIYDTVYKFNTNTGLFSLLGLMPTRAAHTMLVFPVPSTEFLRVAIWGGTDGKGFLNTCHVYMMNIDAKAPSMQTATLCTAIKGRIDMNPVHKVCNGCQGPFAWVSVHTQGHASLSASASAAPSSTEESRASHANINVQNLSLADSKQSGHVTDGVTIPVRRFAHACTMLPLPEGQEGAPGAVHVLLGGVNEEQDLNDLFTIAFTA